VVKVHHDSFLHGEFTKLI